MGEFGFLVRGETSTFIEWRMRFITEPYQKD